MGLILFGVFLFLLIIGVPVAFSICTAAGVTVLSGLGQAKLLILIQRMFEACNSFSLIAVPFFILAGDLLSKGKISKLLVEFCESLLGMIRADFLSSPYLRACSLRQFRDPVLRRRRPSAVRSCRSSSGAAIRKLPLQR